MTAPLAIIILGSAILGALPFAMLWRIAREDADFWFQSFREETIELGATLWQYKRKDQPRDEKGRFIKAAEMRGETA